MSDSKKPVATAGPLTYDDVRSVSPALEHYTKESMLGGLRKRAELSPRDRSVVTVAAIEEVRPGDVVFFEVGEKHWHGASAQVGMVHIAITEVLDGKAVDWLEPVTDEQYAK